MISVIDDFLDKLSLPSSPKLMYTILEQIGDGGSAVVYKAYHPVHGFVAVKQFHEYGFHGKIEAKALQEIQGHPYCIKMLDFWEEESESSIAMELLDGNLLDLADGTMTKSQIIVCIRQLLIGLQHLHYEREVVHFDFKPENIGFKNEPNGSITFKILDLGSAQTLDNINTPAFQSALNKGSIQLTTSSYQPPEGLTKYTVPNDHKGLFLPNGVYHNEKTDVWSLGCIVYELFMGEQLFPKTYNKINFFRVGMFLDGEMDDESVFLRTFLQKCLLENVDERYNVTQLLKLMVEHNMA